MNWLRRLDAWSKEPYETTRGFVLVAYGFIVLALVRMVAWLVGLAF